MSSAVLLVVSILIFGVGLKFYSRYLAGTIFSLGKDEKTKPPAHVFKDGVDFVPTDKKILFGHHYSSIAGAAPIIGPAVAVIWGWAPAFLWIVLGVVFMGAAHDFAVLVLSMRHKGESIGKVAETVLSPRVRTIFLLVIFFLVWMVLAVFSLVIANLFVKFPGTVIPINFEIVIAIILGFYFNKKSKNLLVPSLLAQLGLLLMIYIGSQYPITLGMLGENQVMFWIIVLMIYSFVASILPVWVLLQPRDFINGHQLFLCLGLLILGVLVTNPVIVAPAFNPNPSGAPSWFPFLFITVACGAISGFHGLVCSGTTSKQIYSWKDARVIGYGAMLAEGLLALLATLAVATGFKSQAAWHIHYGSWDSANSLSAKIEVFVQGSGNFLAGLGIPAHLGQILIGVLIISFAATSMDTAARIQRYIIAELGKTFNLSFLQNRFIAALLVVVSVMMLVLSGNGGKGGLSLWPLFGATNQMLAGLSLIVVGVYLKKNNKKNMAFLIPAFFVIFITSLGLVLNIKSYFDTSKWFLLILGSILFLCQIWIICEGMLAITKQKKLSGT